MLPASSSSSLVFRCSLSCCTFQLLASNSAAGDHCRPPADCLPPARPPAEPAAFCRLHRKLLPSCCTQTIPSFCFVVATTREPPGQRRGRERRKGERKEERRWEKGGKKEVVVVEEGEIMVGRRATNEPQALMEKTEGNQDTHQ